MDATQLLTQDHQQVEQLFQRFEDTGDRAHKAKQEIVNQILLEVAVHSQIEEETFYPTVKSQVEAAREEVLESVEEHRLVDLLIEEISKLDPQDEAFTAKVMVLIESVRHHTRQEEEEMFPVIRQELSREELEELGERLQESKRSKLRAS